MRRINNPSTRTTRREKKNSALRGGGVTKRTKNREKRGGGGVFLMFWAWREHYKGVVRATEKEVKGAPRTLVEEAGRGVALGRF